MAKPVTCLQFAAGHGLTLSNRGVKALAAVAFTLLTGFLLAGCELALFNGTGEQENREPEGLSLLWFHSFANPDNPGYFSLTRALPVNEKRVAVALNEYTAVFESETGEIVWSQNHGQTIPLQNRAFGFEDGVLVGNTTRIAMAWNVQTGAPMWEYSFESPNDLFGYSDVTFDGERFLFAGYGSDGIMYRIRKDGSEIDELDTEWGIYQKTYSDGVLYVTHADEIDDVPAANITAYDPETGEVLWRFREKAFGRFVRMPPHVEDDILYSGTMQGNYPQAVFAINRHTGEEIWRSQNLRTYFAKVHGDKIYGSDASSVWALDKVTGELVWQTKSPLTRSEQGLDVYNGKVYWANAYGLIVFDAESGEILEIVDVPGSYIRNVTAGYGYIFVTTLQSIAVYRAL